MNAIPRQQEGGWRPPGDQCEVAVLYDDSSARDRAISLCDRLASHFKGDLDFNFTWWSVRFLKDPEIAHLAEEASRQADLLLFSASEGLEPSAELKGWIEEWLAHRGDGEAALAVQVKKAKGETTPLESYLNAVARRGHLDYLPLIVPEAGHGPSSPQRLFLSNPLSAESSHWGINE